MIKSFKHKGLKKFYDTGNTAGIQAQHARKLQLILTVLDASQSIADMGLPMFKLHELIGNRTDVYSVWVNGNWRITFRFNGSHAEIIDYEDYH